MPAFTIWTGSCYWICSDLEIWTFLGRAVSWPPREWFSCLDHTAASRRLGGTSPPSRCFPEIHVECNVPAVYTSAARVFRSNYLHPTSTSPWRSILILISPPSSAESVPESSPSWRDVHDCCGCRTSWSPSPTQRWCNPRTKRRKIDPNLVKIFLIKPSQILTMKPT